MSARTIFAAMCTALALTLGSAGVALAYGTDSGSAPSPSQDPCGATDGTVLRGTNGDDTGVNALDARQMPNVRIICAFGGNDAIYANNAGDTIYAGPGNDIIYGGARDDHIEGQGGDDTIYDTGVYGGGHDTILGQTGNDTIYSDDGFSDYIDGGTGSNKCFPDPSGDTVKNC